MTGQSSQGQAGPGRPDNVVDPTGPGRRPNILFIYSDQHRWDCVGVNGHPLVQTPNVKTPNIDRIAREGVNFTHAFTPVPLCVPARCSLLTGQWPAQHGVVVNFDAEMFKPLPEGVPTSISAVREAGYRTVHVGRWHVDSKRTPLDFGAEEFVPPGHYAEWRRARGVPPVPSDKGWFGQVDTVAGPEDSRLRWGADRVIDFMRRFVEQGEAFLIRWQMVEPHLPCRPCEPYASMYPPESIRPWPGFADDLRTKPYFQKQMRATWGLEDWTWDDWAPAVSRYLAVITELDHNIGRVLDALDTFGIAGNTLVIYSSDHGDMCGSHGMIDKHGIMYDDVVRVPLMMRLPGVIPAGTARDEFVVNAIDFASTFCDLAGAEPLSTFKGLSLMPLARGEVEEGEWPRQDVFSTYHGNQFGSYSQRMVRDRRWKYVWNATAEDELYDLENDPGELVNLAIDGEHGDELARLRRCLLAWMEETDDSLLNSWTRDQIELARIVSDEGPWPPRA